jgi:polyhydroxyalkanoate synthesis repressor PhaR
MMLLYANKAQIGAGDTMSNAEKAPSPAAAAPMVVVKKYANRRLYNTETSSYITLDNLAEMVRAGRDFAVYDAKTSEDITRSVLTQIIVEEESKGRAMLPTTFLRHLIGFYGDSVQSLVPRYLEQSMASFAHQQQQMRDAMKSTVGNFFPFGMEEVGRNNLAMMERAMSLFTPFYLPPDTDGQPDATRQTPGAGAAPNAPSGAPTGSLPTSNVSPTPGAKQLQAEVDALRSEIAELRARLSTEGSSSQKGD